MIFHLLITKNGTSLKLYLNGVLSKSYTFTVSVLRTNQNNINICHSNNTRPQSIDDLLIFNRALSSEEVTALYLNKANSPKYYDVNNYDIEKKLPPPPSTDGNYTLNVNVASGVATYSWS